MKTKKPKLGSTGGYPDGSFGPHDKGELAMAVSSDNKGNVHIDFGQTDVNWFALPAEQAVSFAKLLLHHAGVKKVTIEF